MKNRNVFGIVSIFACSCGTSYAQESLQKYDVAGIERILRADGYSAVERLEDNLLLLRLNGSGYGIFVDDDGDLQGYYGLSGGNESLETINKWNATKRFSSAYLDDDGDPILKADLDATNGLTEDQIEAFVRLFIQSAGAFRDHLAAN